MALPSPLPDDPAKWSGWSQYSSPDFYARLCLACDSRPTPEQIEEHTRLLLVWWQKKLPLRNQPGNPVAQLLRAGLDAAPRQIAEARSELLNPERRAEIDRLYFERRRWAAFAEFQKFMDFALAEKVLTRDAEAKLIKVGRRVGLTGPDVAVCIHDALIATGATREAFPPPPTPEPPPTRAPAVLRAAAHTSLRRTRLIAARMKVSPEEERRLFPDFISSVGAQMLLIPTGSFLMGSRTPEAPVDEQPATQVAVRRFYLSRHPVTNSEYERFDPDHARWRPPNATDTHPAVYLSHADASKFCVWLGEQENKKYRLPTEAEWEYAARGSDGRVYPWALTEKISLTRFAAPRGLAPRNRDWHESVGEGRVAPMLAGGLTESSPVGKYPAGASPFGIEDLLGNVWQWCQDSYGPYHVPDRRNANGPSPGTERVCRGGSWKSRALGLQATTRGRNPPAYTSNDVGFRIVCECAAVAPSGAGPLPRSNPATYPRLNPA
jgi:formylglycine-generating enzyme required for sulfatase activity